MRELGDFVQYAIVAVSALALLAVAAWWWVDRRSMAALEGELVRLCQGDRARADRLVAEEIARKPGLSRPSAVAFAMARLRKAAASQLG